MKTYRFKLKIPEASEHFYAQPSLSRLRRKAAVLGRKISRKTTELGSRMPTLPEYKKGVKLNPKEIAGYALRGVDAALRQQKLTEIIREVPKMFRGGPITATTAVDVATGSAINRLSNKMGLNSTTSYTTFDNLVQKRLKLAQNLSDPEWRKTKRYKINKFLMNPGQGISDAIEKRISDGGKTFVNNDLVKTGKAVEHALQGFNPMAGYGYYQSTKLVDLGKIASRGSGWMMDKLRGVQRGVTENQYFEAAKRAGQRFHNSVATPLAKTINTVGGAVQSTLGGGGVPLYVQAGTAPMLSTADFAPLTGKVKSIMSNVKQRLTPSRVPQVSIN